MIDTESSQLVQTDGTKVTRFNALKQTVILYCASGGRSALSGKVLKDMGYERVYNAGAFKEWAEGGGPVDKPATSGTTR